MKRLLILILILAATGAVALLPADGPLVISIRSTQSATMVYFSVEPFLIASEEFWPAGTVRADGIEDRWNYYNENGKLLCHREHNTFTWYDEKAMEDPFGREGRIEIIGERP